MLDLILVEFKKMRRRKAVVLLLLSAATMPLISFIYFAGHRKILNDDMIVYKQAIFSFGFWVILPVCLGILAAMLSYNETHGDILKQIWIIPVSKVGYFFSKWVVLLVFSLVFMLLSGVFTLLPGIAFHFVQFRWESAILILRQEVEAGILAAIAILPILALAVSQKGYLLTSCAAILYAFFGFILSSVNPYLLPSASMIFCVSQNLPNVAFPRAYNPLSIFLCFAIWSVASLFYAYYSLREK